MIKMSPQTDKILILGGSGYLGMKLTEHLCGMQAEVIIVDKIVPAKIPKGSTFVKTTGSSLASLAGLINDIRTVVYMASATYPALSARNMGIELESNLVPFMDFLESLESNKNIHTIFVSSGGTVYGNPGVLPVNEETPLAPVNPYGACKASMEHFLRSFSNVNGHKVTIIRPSNIYGPGQPLKKGFGLVRTILDRAMNNTVLEIWGDGRQKRDYLFVDDFITACQIITQTPPATKFTTYNVGSGEGVSVLSLCDVVENKLGVSINKIFMPNNRDQVVDIYLDSTKLRSETGWDAETSLEKGLEQTWAWLSQQT
jgi:UDP-glucose 4-epimerase